MRDYGRVTPTFWTRGSGKKLRGNPRAQVVALYLFTCPAANMIGLYHLAIPTMAHETGLTVPEAERALGEVCLLGIAQYDPEEELVYLPEGAKYQIGEQLKPGDRRVKGVENAVGQFGRHAFVADFIQRYRAMFCMRLEAPDAPPLRPFPRVAEIPGSPFEAPYQGSERNGNDPSEGSLTTPGSPFEARQGSGKDQAKQGTDLSPVATHPDPVGDPSGQMALPGSPEETPADLPKAPRRRREPTPPAPATEVRDFWRTEWTAAGMPGPAPWEAASASCAARYLSTPGATPKSAQDAILGLLRTDAGSWHRTTEGGRHATVAAALAGKNTVAFTTAGARWREAQAVAARPKRRPPPPDPVPEMYLRLAADDAARGVRLPIPAPKPPTPETA